MGRRVFGDGVRITPPTALNLRGETTPPLKLRGGREGLSVPPFEKGRLGGILQNNFTAIMRLLIDKQARQINLNKRRYICRLDREKTLTETSDSG
jgi:hypothetical protein